MLTPSTALTKPSKVLHKPASSMCPGPKSIRSPSICRDAARPPLLNEADGAEAGGDNHEGDDRSDGTERVERRRGDIEGHAPYFERQRIERAGGLQSAGKLVVGERETEQGHRHDAGGQDRNDDKPYRLPAGSAEIVSRLLPSAVETRHHREHDQNAERQRPRQLGPDGRSVPTSFDADKIHEQADADAQDQPWSHEASDHQVKYDAVATKAAAKCQPGQE